MSGKINGKVQQICQQADNAKGAFNGTHHEGPVRLENYTIRLLTGNQLRVAGTASERQKKGIVYFGLLESKFSGPTNSRTSKGQSGGQVN